LCILETAWGLGSSQRSQAVVSIAISQCQGSEGEHRGDVFHHGDSAVGSNAGEGFLTKNNLLSLNVEKFIRGKDIFYISCEAQMIKINRQTLFLCSSIPPSVSG
jgi:hypothetical protein